jgi:hypothetical protein
MKAKDLSLRVSLWSWGNNEIICVNDQIPCSIKGSISFKNSSDLGGEFISFFSLSKTDVRFSSMFEGTKSLYCLKNMGIKFNIP